MEVELHVSSSSSIAVRNEEFNRQRLKNVAPGTVRITDPAKFAALQVRSSRQVKVVVKVVLRIPELTFAFVFPPGFYVYRPR